MNGIPLELIVAAVLSLDAAVVAAFLISRRRRRRATGGAGDGSLLFAERHPDPWWSGPFAPPAQDLPPVAARGTWVRDADTLPADVPPAAPSPVERETPEAPEAAEAEAALPPAKAEPAAPAEAEPPPAKADVAEPPLAEPHEPEPASQPAEAQAGLWPAWVDPMTVAAEATAAWRRALRRDLIRAGSRGRAGVVIQIELAVEGLAAGEVNRLDGLLFDAIAKVVRPTDHFDRTGPARFHLVLWDVPKVNAQTIALRISNAFRQGAPADARLLVGLEAVASEAEFGAAIQRAAEQVDEARRSGAVDG